jgi:hypothetical protein
VASRRINLQRVGVSALVAFAIALIIYGFASAKTGDDALEITDKEAIERVIPAPGALVLRQSQVGIDLQPGWCGTLIIDGQELPVSGPTDTPAACGVTTTPNGLDAQYDPTQNTIYFTPREGATIPDFDAGDHQITAIYWKITESRDNSRNFSWTFKVS